MEAPEAPPIKWTTDEILTMLGINTQGVRNGTQEDMLMEPEGVRHLNDKDVEGIQEACGGYANNPCEWKILSHKGTTKTTRIAHVLGQRPASTWRNDQDIQQHL